MSSRLYFGKLSYNTLAQTLGQKIESLGVKIKEAQIMSRGGRSLGYGFVTLVNPEDADKVISTLNGAEVDGINIVVEHSTSKGPYPPGSGRTRLPRGGRFRGRGRGGIRGRGGRGRGRGGRGRGRLTTQPRTPVNPDAPRSKTRIYVTDIPYHFKDEDFKNCFKEYDIIDAIIIRMYDGTSRGYGFLECRTEAEQKKILEEHPTFEFHSVQFRTNKPIVRVGHLYPAYERPAQPTTTQ